MSVIITNNMDPNDVGTPSSGNLALFSGPDNEYYYKNQDGEYFRISEGGFNKNISLNPSSLDLTITDSNGTLTASLLPLASGYFNSSLYFSPTSSLLYITDGFGTQTASLDYFNGGFNQTLSYNTSSNILTIVDGSGSLTASLSNGGSNESLVYNPFTNVLELTDGFGTLTASLALSVSTSSLSTFSISDILYDDLIYGLSQSSLTASYYRLTDFQTRGWVLGSTDSASYSGPTETLIIFAASGSCYPQAKSEYYPQDEILYDPIASNWMDDRSFSENGIDIIPGFKGVIYNRRDNIRNVEMSFDWRHCEIRRWKFDDSSLNTWSSGTWSRGDFVEDSNSVVYYCLEDHYTDGLTGTSSMNPNEYYATQSTPNNDIIRSNIRYHWMRLFKKDIYILPAWQLGTMSNTYSLGFGTYEDTSPWGTQSTLRLIEIPIDTSDYQDFNVFGIHGTTSTKNDVYSINVSYSRESSKNKFGSIVLTNRIESNKPVIELDVMGSNLTIYDYIPILPISDFSDNSEFIFNKFRNFERMLIYGDEQVASGVTDYSSSWSSNDIKFNCDLFGYSDTTKILTNGLQSTLEESLVVQGGVALLSSIRCCETLYFDTILRSSLSNITGTKVGRSNGDVLIGINQSDIVDSQECRFELNLNQSENTFNTEFGPNFYLNKIGEGGVKNSVISGNFQESYFYGIYNCDIGGNITGLTGSSTQVLQNTIIEPGSISDVDLSTATHIYTNYNTTIYKRPDGTSRLRYWDDTDSFTATDPSS